MSERIIAVLLDVDGTLVDSNDAHADAWVRAFAEARIGVDRTRVRRAIGMGGDKLMPLVGGVTEDSALGARISKRRGEIFLHDLAPTLQPLPGAADLARALQSRGLTVVIATSARKRELGRLLDIAGVRDLVDAATSSDDAEESKPDPEIIQAALRQAGARPAEAMMVGDTPYDIEAASRAGVRTIAFRSGGWSDADLDGAVAIYDGPQDLLARLDESPLAGNPKGMAEVIMSDSERDTGVREDARAAGLDSAASNADWVALGLVAIGMIGAIVGFTQVRPRRGRITSPVGPDSGDFTPPHGDKLLPRR